MPNLGYVLGDIICKNCDSIVATVREPIGRAGSFYRPSVAGTDVYPSQVAVFCAINDRYCNNIYP